MRGRNQECVAWNKPIYFGSASMDCGPICGRSWEDSCVTISGFVHVLQMGHMAGLQVRKNPALPRGPPWTMQWGFGGNSLC